MRRWVLVMAVLLGPAPAEARSSSELREALRTHAAKRRTWRNTLREKADPVGGTVVYHQIRERSHQHKWKLAVTKPGERIPALRRWFAAGRYPGLWTLDEPDGWYGEHFSDPVSLRLAPGTILFDADIPAHREVYRQWLDSEKELRLGRDFEDPMATVTEAKSGVTLARKAPLIHAPQHERFLREMGIAGVAWYDVYGRRCVVLFNPFAVTEVHFPESP